MKGRERAPPAVQHRDPVFFLFFFFPFLTFCIKTILRGETISVIILDIYIGLKFQGAEIKVQRGQIFHFFSGSKDRVKAQSEQTQLLLSHG